jgi:hypothetical protein
MMNEEEMAATMGQEESWNYELSWMCLCVVSIHLFKALRVSL